MLDRVRTDVGIKVFALDLETIDRVRKQIEAALEPVRGSRHVIAAPLMGMGYVQIDIDRERACTDEESIRRLLVSAGGSELTATKPGVTGGMPTEA